MLTFTLTVPLSTQVYKQDIRHKQVVYTRVKMLFTVFKYLFSFQRYASFLNMQISQVMTSYTQPHFDQI